MDLRCPHCRNAFEILEDSLEESEVKCPDCASVVSLDGLLSLDVAVTMPVSDDNVTLSAGDSVGHFRVEKILGKGGFGSVYQAFDSRLERLVALKIPRMSKLSVWHVDSFIREAQAAAQLRHPNIVGVYEVGRDGDRVYIVSEFVEGITLNEWRNETNPDDKVSATIIAKVARAIHAAHEKGVVHRDLKPGNILVDNDGNPQITDFGLAKRDNPEEITITQKGQIVGTPAYMSPEQASGKSTHADRRTDVYSLGVVLYEMLAGRRPFIGSTELLIDEVIAGGPPEIHEFRSDIHRDLEAICLKAMATSPGDRFQTSLEFAEDLERYVNDEPTLTRPLTSVQKLVRRARQNLIPIAVGVVIVSLLASTLYFAASRTFFAEPIRDSTVLVEFSVLPARSDVAIAKVDLDLGRIDYDTIVTPEMSDDKYTIRLVPGWYIIEAHSPGFGLQEVWRYVPVDENDPTKPFSSKDKLANMSWSFQGEKHVRLAPITIVRNSQVNEGDSPDSFVSVHKEKLIRVTGGEFKSGSTTAVHMDGTPRRPIKMINIADFYLAETEVTYERYHDIRRSRSYIMGGNFSNGEIPADAAMTNISFFEALEYCERLGLRLPTYDEYVFAATNGGTTKFPWGDQPQGLDGWESRREFLPEFDRTLGEHPIANLYSSVLEWTQEVDLFRMQHSDKALRSQAPQLEHTFDSRMVVGGPAECVSGRAPRLDGYESPRFFLDIVPNKTDFKGLGFRCAKSITPRLIGRADGNSKNSED